MKLTGTYRVSARREQVFDALIDPGIIQKCIDGCEKMVATGDDPAESGASTYDAYLKIGVAGLKGSYVGKVQLKDRRRPESFTLILEGKGGPGFVKGTAKISLASLGAGPASTTELRCDADAQVGGLIAAVGSRLIEAAAKRMMDEFFSRFVERLAAR